MQPLLFLVISGAGVGDGGARFALEDELFIGRGEARGRARAPDFLTIADTAMSGRHARLFQADGRWHVEDLQSTNGTRLNDVPLTGTSPLADGDVLELGQSLFVFREMIGERASDLDPRVGDKVDGFATLDPSLTQRLAKLERVAVSNLSLLLLGDTGTGKEVLARGIHQLSARSGPFVAVNCGAIPANLVESHLFGHAKGAFSGAVKDEPGHVRAAHQGTLLLDEIGDLPPSAQAALLRVLQEGEVVPVGATQPVKVDVRVLGATHKPLEELVANGMFRRDLYARLSGYVFPVPPLRERKVDIGLLCATLAARGKVAPTLRLHPDVSRAIYRYSWPMNVRELEQCLKASEILADDGVVLLEDLPPAIASAEPEPAEPEVDEDLRRRLIQSLEASDGNISSVARDMGKARQQIQRWLRRLGIDPSAYKGR